jgi:hypothetical protein
MNTKPTLARFNIVATTIAAASSAFIAIVLLTLVAALFQRDGVPFERIVAAERSCTTYVFVSERETCQRAYLASAHVRNLAVR